MQARAKIDLRKRDILLTIILFIFIGGLFLFVRLIAFSDEASIAHIYYGTSSDPIVSINFVNGDVMRHRNQEGVSGEISYPLIDEVNQTITLLGDYRIDGIRQILVIQYNIEKKSVQIIEEQSPNNICSREGESTGWPLICLPNRIRVEFESSDEDFSV